MTSVLRFSGLQPRRPEPQIRFPRRPRRKELGSGAVTTRREGHHCARTTHRGYADNNGGPMCRQPTPDLLAHTSRSPFPAQARARTRWRIGSRATSDSETALPARLAVHTDKSHRDE